MASFSYVYIGEPLKHSCQNLKIIWHKWDLTKPFNVGSSSAHQQNAISMAFCWRADDGPFMVVFVSSIALSTNIKNKKTLSNLDCWLFILIFNLGLIRYLLGVRILIPP